jgi:hypothetical protein
LLIKYFHIKLFKVKSVGSLIYGRPNEQEGIMENKGIDFASIPQTAIRVITSPASFYREMPKKAGRFLVLVVMAVVRAYLAVASLLGLNPGRWLRLSAYYLPMVAW